MSAPTFEQMQPKYESLLASMEIHDSKLNKINAAAHVILQGKDMYIQVSDALHEATGATVPWQFIGLLHYRESDCNFRTHLHNGDSLLHRTHNVPAGRPPHGEPPFKFVDSAVDALEMQKFQNITDWSLARVCYEGEKYNGWGYHNHGCNSAYLWSGSNNYVSGKYVSDGVWDANHVDTQLGIIPILKRILALDVPESTLVAASSKLNVIQNMKAWVVATFGSYFTLDTLQMIPDKVQNFKALGLGIKEWSLVALLAFIWAVFNYIHTRTVTDYKEGRYKPSGFVEIPHDPEIHL